MTPMFHAEVQLAGWSESHNGGCKVTFWLAESSDLDAFRAMTVRKGNTAGQRLACALVEIGDDEKPVQPPAPCIGRDPLCPCQDGDACHYKDTPTTKGFQAPEHPKGGPLAKLAGQWCGTPEFVEFIRQVYDKAMGGDGSGWGDVTPADDFKGNKLQYARHCILVLCDITSRAQLDHDEAAAQKFHALIREPFSAWLKGRGA